LALRCEADANPPASIVWRRAGRSEIASLSENLQLRPVGRRDSGLYSCQAQNSVGTSDVLSVQLDIKCKFFFSIKEIRIEFFLQTHHESFQRDPIVSQPLHSFRLLFLSASQKAIHSPPTNGYKGKPLLIVIITEKGSLAVRKNEGRVANFHFSCNEARLEVKGWNKLNYYLTFRSNHPFFLISQRRLFSP
jgi:Immunoglobulin domain